MVGVKSEIDYFFVSSELATLQSKIKADDRYGMWPHLAVQLSLKTPGNSESVETHVRIDKYGTTLPIGPPMPPPSYQVPLKGLRELEEEVTNKGHVIIPTQRQLEKYNRAFSEYCVCLGTDLADIFHSPDARECGVNDQNNEDGI